MHVQEAFFIHSLAQDASCFDIYSFFSLGSQAAGFWVMMDKAG